MTIREEGYAEGYRDGYSKRDGEIVRCKDCRFGEERGQLVGCGLMAGFGITHKPDWFCADAERKDGDGE